MDRAQLVIELDDLLTELEKTRSELAEVIKDGLGRGDRLREAVRTVADSSSDSWVGWHSRMYYAGFAEPPVAESWNTEWGGINGFSSNWQERSVAEVQQEVERRAGLKLGDVARIADRVREACVPLKDEVLTILSPICDLTGLVKESELLQDIEKVKWIVAPSQFIQAMVPSQIWSRDSAAMSQGAQAPLHLNVDAAIVSNTSTIAMGRDFLDKAVRLVRQVRTKVQAAHVLAPAADPESPDERLARQLRSRSTVLFLVLACAIAVGGFILLDRVSMPRVAEASVIVGGALIISAIYGLLLDRSHALRALGIAAAVGGALAAVDQLLGAFR